MDAVVTRYVEARVDAIERLDLGSRVALLLDHEDLGLQHRERLRGRAVIAKRVGDDLPAAHANGHDARVLPHHRAAVVRRVRARLDQ